MPKNLPYVASPGSIRTALERIREAATPDRVTKDFVSTKLRIKGGTGSQISPFLKKIGLVASDGTPTELYKQFRNTSSGGAAIAEAIKHGYSDLSQVNEYFYDLNDKELFDLILQVTGADKESSAAKQTLSCLNVLKSFADFEASNSAEPLAEIHYPEDLKREKSESKVEDEGKSIGLNLSYTINLNLPATSDQAVFNAIFKSLKEHLLSNE